MPLNMSVGNTFSKKNESQQVTYESDLLNIDPNHCLVKGEQS